MTPPRHPPEGRSLARWGTRADVVIKGTRREFSYRWTAPRSPALKVILVPVFVAALLIVLILGALVLTLALALAVVAAVAFALVGLFWSIADQLGVRRNR